MYVLKLIFREKVRNHTYSDCVSVALVIQQAKRMRHIAFGGLVSYIITFQIVS